MSDFVGEACESLFNLQKVANLLLKYDFKCIVLQFPDEHDKSQLNVHIKFAEADKHCQEYLDYVLNTSWSIWVKVINERCLPKALQLQ